MTLFKSSLYALLFGFIFVTTALSDPILKDVPQSGDKLLEISATHEMVSTIDLTSIQILSKTTVSVVGLIIHNPTLVKDGVYAEGGRLLIDCSNNTYKMLDSYTVDKHNKISDLKQGDGKFYAIEGDTVIGEIEDYLCIHILNIDPNDPYSQTNQPKTII